MNLPIYRLFSPIQRLSPLPKNRSACGVCRVNATLKTEPRLQTTGHSHPRHPQNRRRKHIFFQASRHHRPLRAQEKLNIFEPFFSDWTLTFLTSGNTFRLPILPTRRAVLLCLPQILIRGRQRKIRGRQIFPGCASKTPDFKGKVNRVGGKC